jgi:hypothetical protein
LRSVAPGALLLAVVAAMPAAAQRGWDAHVHALALVRDSTLLAGGVGGGLRMGRGLRIGATLSGGGLVEGGAAGRGEAMLAYHLSPPREGSVGAYAGAGIAGEVHGGDVRGLIIALLGVEARPWGRGGWFVEAGVGGGVRLAAGYRAIRLAPRRRTP